MSKIRPEKVIELEKNENIIFVDYHSFHEILEKVIDYLWVTEFDFSKKNRNYFIDGLKDFQFLKLENNKIKYSLFPSELISYLLTSDLKKKTKELEVVKITEVKFPINPTVIYFDTETSGKSKNEGLDPNKNKIELIQLNINGEIILCTPRDCDNADLVEFVKKLFTHYVVGHNLLFDISTLFAKTGLLPTVVYDTLQAEILINMTKEGRTSHSVFTDVGYGSVVEKYCNIRLDKSNQTSNWGGIWTKSQLKYAKNDVVYLPEILKIQVDQLNNIDDQLPANEYGLKNVVARLEMKTLLSLFPMVVRGIPINKPFIEKRKYNAYLEEEEIKKKLQKLFPYVENYNSGKQMLQACERKGISMPNYQSSTINKYAKKYDEIKVIESFKKASQIRKNLKKYKGKIVYPQWVLIGSPPGRMTTKEPPVQNIPRSIKEDFYDPRMNLIRADYPAIELRICAQFINEKAMIEAFNKDEDLHKLTASLVVGKEISEITKEERQLAKSMNYGLIYGMGATRFKENTEENFGLKMTLEEAMKYKERFYSAYPNIHKWHKSVGYQLKSGGIFVSTLMGRKIWFPESEYNNALNAPIQGTGADMLKLAVTILDEKLKKFPTARILSLIHDEIIIDAGKENMKLLGKILKESMEYAANVIMPDLPTSVDVEYFPEKELEESGLPEIKEKISKLKKTQLNLLN